MATRGSEITTLQRIEALSQGLQSATMDASSAALLKQVAADLAAIRSRHEVKDLGSLRHQWRLFTAILISLQTRGILHPDCPVPLQCVRRQHPGVLTLRELPWPQRATVLCTDYGTYDEDAFPREEWPPHMRLTLTLHTGSSVREAHVMGEGGVNLREVHDACGRLFSRKAPAALSVFRVTARCVRDDEDVLVANVSIHLYCE